MSKQERTFHKHSTNIAQTFLHLTGMKPKRLSLIPNLPHLKSTFLFGSGEQILDQIEIICYQQDKFRNDTKTFWFRFQNNIRTFVLSFLTLLIRYDRVRIFKSFRISIRILYGTFPGVLDPSKRCLEGKE